MAVKSYKSDVYKRRAATAKGGYHTNNQVD